MIARAPITFLEATKLLAEHKDGKPLSIDLCLSGTPLQLELFLRAEAARNGVALSINSLAFGALQQHLLIPAQPDAQEVFVLCPWDMVASLDWRTGVPSSPISIHQASIEAKAAIKQIRNRQPRALLYLPAPLPPTGLSPGESLALRHSLQALAAENEATFLPEEAFALGSYLATGCPIAGPKLGIAAHKIANALFANREPKKVLVTDLDDTLWAGIISEDGLDGISAAPDGVGFRHFLYQSLLLKLKNAGILVAAVSRNDSATARSALAPGRMILSENDFAVLFVSYKPKSAQVAEIARRFNLGLHQFVFVDDNILELEEVKGAHPEVVCLPFPKLESELLSLFDDLHSLFQAKTLTAEDQKRTELYRLKAEGALPVDGTAHDLTTFLKDLKMVLTIHNRDRGDRARAVQLINKTNQFNLNGRRWDDSEVGVFLGKGGRLVTASLADRTGEHGEILALLIDPENVVHALVLSCRVFQRRIEHAILLWLMQESVRTFRLLPMRTEKNEPLWQFLADPSFIKHHDGSYLLDASAFQQRHGAVMDLFRLVQGENNVGN